MKCYDREGRLITLQEWQSKDRLGSDDYRRIEYTEIGDVHVSTVWLGLDHSFGEGPPLIFETMVFGGELDQTQERYSTEIDARAGHDRLVTRILQETP